MHQAPQGRNLAGIIPLTGRPDTLDLPWPDYMHPISEGMLAVERSVYECAYAGCDSIWVVCNDNFAPLVKSRIGDYVMSPRYFEEKSFVKKPDYHEKWIPIFYTPVLQKDRQRRDSLGWSVLHGAMTSFLVSSRMSKWTQPTKYYVSFPYGLYSVTTVRQHRSEIRGNKSFFLSYKGETVRDNKYLGFTFFPEDWVKFKRHMKNQCTGGDKSMPYYQRWSSQHFTLDKIFNLDIIGIDKKVEIQNYYDIDSWENLREFYISNLRMPSKSKKFMKPYIFKQEINYEQNN